MATACPNETRGLVHTLSIEEVGSIAIRGDVISVKCDGGDDDYKL